MSLSLASNFSKNHPTGKGQRLSDFCAKHSTHHVEEACLGFGTSHKLSMLTGMSSKQDLSGEGYMVIFHIFLSKCNPLVLCAVSTHDALEMKPSAVLVPLLKGLESCVHSSGSRETNPKPDMDTV